MNEQNSNQHNIYPVNEAPNWVDEDETTLRHEAIAVQALESEFGPLEEAQNSNDSRSAVTTKLDKLASCFDELNQQFSDRLAADSAKEKAFEYLYSELESVKQDYSFERFKPLYLDLILLFDRLDNVCQELEITTASTENIDGFLQTLREEILEILYRQSIEMVATGSTFDPTQQRAIATETTDIKEENNRLAALVRRGFRYQNRLIRPEEVIVKKFRG